MRYGTRGGRLFFSRLISLCLTPPVDTDSKIEMRRVRRAARRALSPEQQRRAAAQLAHRVTSLRLFRASRRIACYLANDGEIDPIDVLERIWGLGKLAYLPVLALSSHERLWFAPAIPGVQLATNRLGILEPVAPRRERLRAEDLDLILMPLVAFDVRGNRLGMGGGFYDRSLAFLGRRRYWRKPRLVGLAHDCQRAPLLKPDPWDIKLDAVVTDAMVYYVTG